MWKQHDVILKPPNRTLSTPWPHLEIQSVKVIGGEAQPPWECTWLTALNTDRTRWLGDICCDAVLLQHPPLRKSKGKGHTKSTKFEDRHWTEPLLQPPWAAGSIYSWCSPCSPISRKQEATRLAASQQISLQRPRDVRWVSAVAAQRHPALSASHPPLALLRRWARLPSRPPAHLPPWRAHVQESLKVFLQSQLFSPGWKQPGQSLYFLTHQTEELFGGLTNVLPRSSQGL